MNYLTENPHVGMAGGFGSGFLMSIQSIVTDENSLKVVAGLGVFFGTLVAGITLILKLIEFGKTIVSPLQHAIEKIKTVFEKLKRK